MADFVAVGKVGTLAPGQMRQVLVGDEEIALYNVNGELHATSDICSHEEAYLSEGELIENVVECPLHGARFDVRTGKALSLPAVFPVKTYEVRVVDGKIEVRV